MEHSAPSAVPAILEPLLGVHSASNAAWLADAAAQAAERGLGALYTLLYVREDSDQIEGVRPASTERMRRIAKLRQTLDAEVLGRFQPSSLASVQNAVQGGRAVSVARLSEALPAPPEEAWDAAQRQLGIAEVWLSPLYRNGETLGLLVLLMPAGAGGSIGLAEVLGRHLAVALHNLREKDAGRRRGQLDATRWVYDEQRFMEELDMESRRAQRHGRPLSVLLIRIRNFEGVHDRYGRFLAERVLRRVAAELSDAMRDTDFLGAAGSDGFGMILVEADEDGATRAKERLLAGLKALDLAQAGLPQHALDIGCVSATMPADGTTADQLAARARSRLDEDAAREERAASAG